MVHVADGRRVLVPGTVLPEATFPRRSWCRVMLDRGAVLPDVRIESLVEPELGEEGQ